MGLLLVACTNLLDVPDSPGVEGVLEIKADTLLGGDFPGERTQVFVREDGEDDCGWIYRVMEDTRIGFERSDGLAEKAGLTDVTVGARVRVWADGVCNLSCPGVCAAAWILILDED